MSRTIFFILTLAKVFAADIERVYKGLGVVSWSQHFFGVPVEVSCTQLRELDDKTFPIAGL